eukprot:11298-Heterococcus_DN1.PRE.2
MLSRAVASRGGVWWLRSASVSRAQPATKVWFSSASVPKHDCRRFTAAARPCTKLRALCSHRFQHLGRGLSTGTGDGDAKQEQLMHHLIDQHVAAFIDEHQRDPSPDELKVIQISMHIFSTLCVGHAVQHEQPVSPEHAAVYQDYAQHSSAIAYFERESAMLDYAVTEIRRKTGQDPEDSVYKEIYAKITKLLAKDTELHSNFMEANAKLQKGLQEIEDNKASTKSSTAGAELFSSEELTVQRQLKQVTVDTIQRIKSSYKQRYGAEPNSDDLKEAILEQFVPTILQIAAKDESKQLVFSERADTDALWPSATAAVDAAKVTAAMTKWCTHFVTSLALCPHAAKVPLNMVIHSTNATNTTDNDDDDESSDTAQRQKYALIADQLRSVWTAGNALLQSTEVSSLVVLPNSPLHWNAFDMFCTTAAFGLDHIGIHTHCYHPLAVVTSSASGNAAAANYRRRAPWPTIHLLKQHAIDELETGHVSGTMARALAIGNEKELSERGIDAVKALLAECCVDSNTASSTADATITTTASAAATTTQPAKTVAAAQRTVAQRRSRPPARQPKPHIEAVSQQ